MIDARMFLSICTGSVYWLDWSNCMSKKRIEIIHCLDKKKTSIIPTFFYIMYLTFAFLLDLLKIISKISFIEFVVRKCMHVFHTIHNINVNCQSILRKRLRSCHFFFQNGFCFYKNVLFFVLLNDINFVIHFMFLFLYFFLGKAVVI